MQLLIRNALGRFQSGQMGQTVNLLSYDFGGSNPPLPTSSFLIIGYTIIVAMVVV
jgi:hypothetical protein